MSEEIQQLIEQAARCYRLARQMIDHECARKLRELGEEYTARAISRGADPRFVPQP